MTQFADKKRRGYENIFPPTSYTLKARGGKNLFLKLMPLYAKMKDPSFVVSKSAQPLLN